MGDFNKWFYRTMTAIAESGAPLDDVAMIRHLREDRDKPEDAVFLTAELIRKVPTPSHKEFYFTTLRRERCRRYLHSICEEAKTRDLLSPNDPLSTLRWMSQHVAEAVAKLEELS